MKYCKNCHIVYSSYADACPRCGVKQPQNKQEEPAESGRVRRDWIWLIIGIPALIGIIYLAALLIKTLG